jgi:Fe-S-cluster containining protein
MGAHRTVDTKAEGLDCTKCGACCWCHADQDYFCDLTEEEISRLSPQFIRANVRISRSIDVFAARCDGRYLPVGALKTKWRRMKSGPFKGTKLNVCRMLEGSVLKRVRCRVYETRPKACREAVKPGDEACLQVRSMLLGLL